MGPLHPTFPFISREREYVFNLRCDATRARELFKSFLKVGLLPLYLYPILYYTCKRTKKVPSSNKKRTRFEHAQKTGIRSEEFGAGSVLEVFL